ncbi:MAG: hypothetical protein ACRDJN_05890, partial [Chloroflexota bacterium]
GLVECLVESRPMQVACRDSFLDNLHLLPAGGPAPQGGRLLRSSAMAAGLDTLRRLYDIVILDIPAILSNSDSLLLTDLADGVILVVRAGVTPAPLVNRAMEELDSGKFRGVVLNEAHSSIPRWLRRLLGL